jgi:hypothetical protein
VASCAKIGADMMLGADVGAERWWSAESDCKVRSVQLALSPKVLLRRGGAWVRRHFTLPLPN